MNRSKNRKFFSKSRNRFILFLLAIVCTTPSYAQTFFLQGEVKKPSGYYNNEDVRSEKIKQKAAQSSAFSRNHRNVANFLNSPNEPVAAEAVWMTEKTLRIGVISRARVDTNYVNAVCNLINANNLPRKGTTVRVIYLPNLIAYNRLETLVEHSCV